MQRKASGNREAEAASSGNPISRVFQNTRVSIAKAFSGSRHQLDRPRGAKKNDEADAPRKKTLHKSKSCSDLSVDAEPARHDQRSVGPGIVEEEDQSQSRMKSQWSETRQKSQSTVHLQQQHPEQELKAQQQQLQEPAPRLEWTHDSIHLSYGSQHFICEVEDEPVQCTFNDGSHFTGQRLVVKTEVTISALIELFKLPQKVPEGYALRVGNLRIKTDIFNMRFAKYTGHLMEGDVLWGCILRQKKFYLKLHYLERQSLDHNIGQTREAKPRPEVVAMCFGTEGGKSLPNGSASILYPNGDVFLAQYENGNLREITNAVLTSKYYYTLEEDPGKKQIKGIIGPRKLPPQSRLSADVKVVCHQAKLTCPYFLQMWVLMQKRLE